jgi:hypothetical protein
MPVQQPEIPPVVRRMAIHAMFLSPFAESPDSRFRLHVPCPANAFTFKQMTYPFPSPVTPVGLGKTGRLPEAPISLPNHPVFQIPGDSILQMCNPIS